MATTLADVQPGQTFLFACQVTGVDTAGVHLAFYGPDRAQAATAVMAADGSMTGMLSLPPVQIPVSLVSGAFAPLAAGDVVEAGNGETAVVRRTWVAADGGPMFSASVTGGAAYRAAEWNVIGHIDL
jgi:hypothetical protein